MDRLADEVLQLVFNELDEPASFASLSRRYHTFSQDPYVRARYFLARHGRIQALYYALGRPSVLTERVLEVLLSSGAHISRYLVQLAIHHYFRTNVPFIKHHWVRHLPLPIFSHFLKLATIRLGDFSTSKGEDDGAIFHQFVKESRMSASSRTIKSEIIHEMLEKYRFMPFCDKDPIMAQFPLALAIEPRFLPLAVANGFQMDSSYRDYVFRRMFERTSSPTDAHTHEILHNVRELCRLDPSMFVSQTVAAEVCMEAQSNVAAYSALKALDRHGELKFELTLLVQDLIKSFVSTRSLTADMTVQAIQHLYRDFLGYSSTELAVRLVLLLTVFACPTPGLSATVAHTKLQALKLTPLSRGDLVSMLLNPFIEQFSIIGSYATVFMGFLPADVKELLTGVAVECLPLASKGSMIKAIVKRYPEVEQVIASVVLEQYRLRLDDLPFQDCERECARFSPKLCGDLYSVPKNVFLPRKIDRPIAHNHIAPIMDADKEPELLHTDEERTDTDMDSSTESSHLVVQAAAELVAHSSVLGSIGQVTLTAAIRNDDLSSGRRRRYTYHSQADYVSLLPYPAETIAVAKWAVRHFGSRHPVTAVFMDHVNINQPSPIFSYYVTHEKVPITLMHFKMLARLGRAPTSQMYNAIDGGCEFYASAEDYLGKGKCLKLESSTTNSSSRRTSCNTHIAPNTKRKRPRRSAASVKSYAIPGSDDEYILGVDWIPCHSNCSIVKLTETDFSKWVRHLAALHREELRKFNEKKKQAEKANMSGERLRFSKNEFLRSLGPRLRDWRRRDELRKLADAEFAPGASDEDEGDDGEYCERSARRSKRPRSQPVLISLVT